MIIILSPSAAPNDDAPPTVSGDVIIYRGVSYDFSQLVEGAEVPVGYPFLSSVIRVNGDINCKLEYRYNMATSPPDQPMSWDAYTFDVEDGQCDCPILRLAEVDK